MTIGPGKYDDLCTYVREQVGIPSASKSVGGVIVIVIDGDRGSGFSCQADFMTTLLLPELLENIANQIRETQQNKEDK